MQNMTKKIRLDIFFTFMFYSVAGLAAGAKPAPGDVVAAHSFDRGPEAWHTGKDKTHTRGVTWHRNILGFYGEPVFLKWRERGGRSGGFAYSESPWYFDDNHGHFGWLHLLANRYTEPEKQGRPGSPSPVVGQDLRNAVVRVSLRGRDVELKGTRLYFWLGGSAPPIRAVSPADLRPRPTVRSSQREAHRWWALTSVPLEAYLTDEKWHDVEFQLEPDERKWTYLGLINGGLRKKIQIRQSLSFGDGSLPHVLGNGKLYVFGFILVEVDPLDQPTGMIDMDEFSIATFPSNPPLPEP
jgi:hypothetical protein